MVIPDESKLRTRSRHSVALFIHPDDNVVIDPALFVRQQISEDIEAPKRHIALMTAYQHVQLRLRQSYAINVILDYHTILYMS